MAARKLIDEASRLSSQGTAESLRRAIEKFQEALPLIRSSGDRGDEASVLNSIGAAYGQLNDSAKSIDFYNQALLLFRAENNRSGEASVLTGIGLAYVRLNDYKKALDALNQSLPLYRALGDRGGEGASVQQIGYASFSQGEYLKAVEFYNQALALFRAAGDRRREASVIFNLGQAYYQLGDYQKALDLYGEALSINRAVLNRSGEAAALGASGQVYRFLGQHQKALDNFNQALAVFRALGARLSEATALNNSAHVYVLMGDYQKALDLFSESLQICRLVGNRAGEAANTNGIGLAHAGMHQYGKALDFYSQALAMFRAIDHRGDEADSLGHIARAHLSLGEHQKSLDYSNDALAIYRAARIRGGDRGAESQTLYTIARAYQARGDLVEAKSHIEAAIRLAETFRHEVASQQLRTSYLATVRDYYELNIDLLMQLHGQRSLDGLAAVALETSERSRARSLLDLLAEARTDIRQGVEPALIERELSLRQLINTRAERQTQLLSGKATPEQVATAAREIEGTLAEYQDVQARIRAASPRYAALTQPEPLSLKQIQEQVLDAETLLLEYALGEKRSYLWAVTQTSITGYELPGRAEIEAAARSFYDLAKDKTNYQELEQSAARLSKMVLAPAGEQLGMGRLAIVADGALQYVPFSALPDPRQKAEGGRQTVNSQSAVRHPQSGYRPLILEHEVVSLPSATTLAVLRRETKGRALAPRLVAVLADPVFDNGDVRVRRAAGAKDSENRSISESKPSELSRSVEETGLAGGGWPLPRLLGTRREARTILSLVSPQESRQALDFEASRETATGGDLSQYQIVHFATHGLINNRHPELSGLVLSLVDKRGLPQNGFLRLNDIYNLRLPAELVVLSACQTGLGKEIRGEGFIGLTRGFMYAGAKRMIASLWQVDDAAASELMSRFYRGVLKEKKLSPAAALRAAQIEMWKQAEWRSPYYWAAFALQGEWR